MPWSSKKNVSFSARTCMTTGRQELAVWSDLDNLTPHPLGGRRSVSLRAGHRIVIDVLRDNQFWVSRAAGAMWQP